PRQAKVLKVKTRRTANRSRTNSRRRNSPPWPRRVGDINKNIVKHPLTGADGVVGSIADYRMLNPPPRLRASKVASHHSYSCAQPPLSQGGEFWLRPLRPDSAVHGRICALCAVILPEYQHA